MTNKFEIVVSATDKASKPLDKIDKKFKDLAKSSSKVGDAINKSNARVLKGVMSSAGESILAAGVNSPLLGAFSSGMSVAALGASLAGALNASARWGTSVSRVSARTGIGLRDLQRLQGAARRSNVDPDLVDSGLRGLGGTLEDVLYGRPGGMVQAQILKTLGITLSKTATGAPDTAKAFQDISEAVSKMKNPEAQNLIARQFNLEELLPMMVKGRTEINRMGDAAEHAGEVMGTKGVEGLDRFSNSLSRLNGNLVSMRNRGSSFLAPGAADILDSASDDLEGKTSWSQRVGKGLLSNPLGMLGIGGYMAFKSRYPGASANHGATGTWNEGGASGSWADDSKPLPLGLRNNNPGNIRSVRTGGFLQFGSMLAGATEMGAQLGRYYNRDRIDTVSGVIEKWAPKKENNTAAYIADVANRSGLDPSKHLDLNNPETLASLMRAMIAHENSGQSIDPQVLAQAVAEALRRAPIQVTVQHSNHAAPQIGYAMPGMP